MLPLDSSNLLMLQSITEEVKKPKSDQNILRVGIENGQKLVCITKQSDCLEKFLFIVKRFFRMIDTSALSFEKFKITLIHDANTTIHSLSERIATLQKELGPLQQEHHALVVDKETLVSDKKILDDLCKSTRETLKFLEEQRSSLQQSLNELQKRELETQERKQKLEQQQAEIKTQKESYEKEKEHVENLRQDIRESKLAFLKEGVTASTYVLQARQDIESLQKRIEGILNAFCNIRHDRYDSPDDRIRKTRKHGLHAHLLPIFSNIRDRVITENELHSINKKLDAIEYGSLTHQYYHHYATLNPVDDTEKDLFSMMRLLVETKYNYQTLMGQNYTSKAA